MTNIEIIKGCLLQINPASLQYDEWLQVGAAIKHEGGSVDMWDTWSQPDKRYRVNDCQSRWSGLDKGQSSVTVATVVKLCKDAGGTPPRSEVFVPDSRMDQPIPMDEPVFYYDPGREETERKKEPERIVRKEWLEIEPLPPDQPDTSGVRELELYLNTLFQADEHVGYVATAFKSEPDKDGNVRWLPGGKGIYSQTAAELLKRCAATKNDIGSIVGDCEPECGAWIRFNPLDGKGVSDNNVTDYRFALVESDEIGIDEQYTICRKLELPIAALVHSGGKSLHAIVRIDATDYKEYQKRVDFLYDICKKNGLVIDRKNRNPSRLSRMPGVMRNGVRQRLVGVNLGKSSWTEWVDWIAAQNDDLPDVESLDSVWGHLPDLQECLIDGILRKGHKMLVSGPSKAGKSFLLLELVIAIAEGRKWVNWQCRQGRVLYVNLELDRASCLHRIKDIYDTYKINNPSTSNIDVWNLRGKSLPMDDLAPRLIRRALKRGYSAIIIDPIYKVITGDENSADQMAKFCNQFDKVCSELQCAVIYCHHHSKGDQGQKRAQDRASGSGVFARDPDALIDMVELEIDEKRREQIKYKFRVKRLQKLLDAEANGWRDGLDMEDMERAEKLIEIARERLPNKADVINNDELKQSDAMTGWRIGGILREFPGFTPQYAFFRYPIHVTGSDVDTLLQDTIAVGELQVPNWVKEKERKANLSKEEREAEEKAKEDKRKAEEEQKRANAINETRMAFDAVSVDGKATVKDLAKYLDISDRAVRDRVNNAGFERNKKTGEISWKNN